MDYKRLDMSKSPPKIIKASRSLQLKAGKGFIPQSTIDDAEDKLKNNAEDFSTLASGLLLKLNDAIQKTRANTRLGNSENALISKPVMELKASAKMMKYDLVTSLATIMLDFLETIDAIDSDVLDIAEMHSRTLSLIITQKMSGNGGPAGIKLQTELKNACQRYFLRKK